jgi:hypothetical protein
MKTVILLFAELMYVKKLATVKANTIAMMTKVAFTRMDMAHPPVKQKMVSCIFYNASAFCSRS